MVVEFLHHFQVVLDIGGLPADTAARLVHHEETVFRHGELRTVDGDVSRRAGHHRAALTGDASRKPPDHVDYLVGLHTLASGTVDIDVHVTYARLEHFVDLCRKGRFRIPPLGYRAFDFDAGTPAVRFCCQIHCRSRLKF